MAVISTNVSRVELTKLKNSVTRQIMQNDVTLIDPEVRATEIMDRMVYELSAYVLADHVDKQTATYQNIELPKYLKWLKRFLRVTHHEIGIDAYWTYPNANVAIPKLGKAHKVVTIYDTETFLPKGISK